MAVLSAGLDVELREIKLKDKPQVFLNASPSATVPNLQAGDLNLDESLDIMCWALGQNDPHGLLNMPEDGQTLIAQNDGPFKTALDHTKYATRYPDVNPEAERAQASEFVQFLETKLTAQAFLTGHRPTLADLAIFPFVRQFAHIDRAWFDAQSWPKVIAWLDGLLQSTDFETAMRKIPVWEDGACPVFLGDTVE